MESRSTETLAPEVIGLSHIRILSPGCEVGERYEVLRVLGIGGTGVVYAVFDRALRRTVALKVLRSDRMSETALKRFRREVAIARDVQSDHLVRVFDMAQSADSIYLTMECIQGRSLAQRLEDGALSIHEAVRVGTQILEALQALHDIGIVHRDIKPSNVMLTPEGLVKLTDFGLARRIDSETRATESESVVGTYEYVSPEQALGNEIDARSDLYSFGILLFECLAGDVPLRSGSSLGTVIAHISKPIPNVRSRRKDVPRWLARIVQRLLQKQPSDRYQTAGQVLRYFASRRSGAWGLPRFRKLGVAAVLLLAILAGWSRRVHGSQFAEFISDGHGGGKALNRRGELLWANPFLQPSIRSAVVTMSDGAKRVAGIAWNTNTMDFRETHHLVFLDTQSGAETDSIDLPDLASYFPDQSDTFGPCNLSSVDIDHDGVSEIVVSYCHHPSFPSYSILVDLRRHAAYPVLLASGHHRLIGTFDADGDGRDELIFWGPSNRLGWSAGLAAVRFDARSWDMGDGAVASTPDAQYSLTSDHVLLWYALVGKGGFDPATVSTVDPIHKEVVIDFPDHTRTRIDANGLQVGAAATRRDVRGRMSARQQAYADLRVAIRLSQTGFAKESTRQIDDAIEEADRAHDVPLGVWVRRARIRLLIAAGQTSGLEEIVRDVQARSASPADVSFDAATAFHLRGDAESALLWYRDGVRLLADGLKGRMSWEFLEGEVFALSELKRWDEATDAVNEFLRAFPQSTAARDYYTAWIHWRASGSFERELPGGRNLIDFSRYVALESSAARGDADPDTIIARIDAEMSNTSGIYRPALQSLKAMQLARKGDRTKALLMADLALRDAKALWTVESDARAHTAIIAERLAALRERTTMRSAR
jgi:tRNA A-37 threonylcarbamoyl transferase component Bud32/tetratricopeptide (TPR) repeat protein